MKTVFTEKAAQPLGHYSQAVIHSNTVYLSTQLGIDQELGPTVVGSIQEQTARALNNVQEILKAVDLDLTNVIKVTIYLSNIKYWEDVNRVYSTVFKEHKPARGIIPCKELHNGFQVAFDVIAAYRI
jgi:2-iminobutanoate/2-iminopropanoate deaminase